MCSGPPRGPLRLAGITRRVCLSRHTGVHVPNVLVYIRVMVTCRVVACACARGRASEAAGLSQHITEQDVARAFAKPGPRQVSAASPLPPRVMEATQTSTPEDPMLLPLMLLLLLPIPSQYSTSPLFAHWLTHAAQ